MTWYVVISVMACNFHMQADDKKPVCREFELPRYEFEQPVSPMQCALQSQNEVIQKWLPQHADWAIIWPGIRCKVTNDKNHVDGGI